MENKQNIIDGIDYSNQHVRELISYIISGFAESEIIEIIPLWLQSWKGQTEELAELFNRIIIARPAAMNKADLMLLLHRLMNIDAKTIVNAIDVLLLITDEWKVDVCKNILITLLNETNIPTMIMRTILLFIQKDTSSNNELKEWFLSIFLIEIINKKIFDHQAAVWEGVVFAMNKFSSHKSIDRPLTLLIHELPILKLVEFIKNAPAIKPVIKNLIPVLTVKLTEPRLTQINDILNGINTSTSTNTSDTTDINVTTTAVVAETIAEVVAPKAKRQRKK